MDKKTTKTGKLSQFIRENKWLSVIIASVALIVCASVVILILAISGKFPPVSSKNPKDNPITNGEDSVTYYYGVAGGEVVLTFKSGWRFTLEGPELSKSGEYTVDGDEVTLDFVRLKDGTATATVGENKMTVILDGVTCTFRKKINFTVSFETNGGSEIDPITVVNGKTITSPASPTKENCSFIGWFADEALTIPFNFGGSLITSDTVIYAKWMELSTQNAE